MFPRFLFALFFLTLAGCLPKERIWWSPDGNRAAVLIDHEVHLTNSSGEIIAKLQNTDSDPGTITTEEVTWLTDGSGIIVNQIRAIPEWKEIRPLLSIDKAKRIEALADKMAALLTAQFILQPEVKSLQPVLSNMLPDEEEIANNAFLLAYQQQPEVIVEILKHSTLNLKAVAEQMPLKTFNLHELALLKINKAHAVHESRILIRDIRIIGNCRISPKFPVIAFARRDAGGLSVAIETYSLKNSDRRKIADGAYAAFDWTPDGRSLVYMTPMSGFDSTIKQIRKIELLADSGDQAAKTHPNRPIDIANAVIPFLPRISVLSDGRILFAAQPVEWPAKGTYPIIAPRLYLLSTDGGVIEPIPTSKGDLPMNLAHFVPSPDGKLVAIVESDTDALVIVDLETGEMDLVSNPHPFWKCRTLPAWRNNNELTFAALGDSGQIDWMLHDTRGDLKSLSQSWPKKFTAEWLEYKPQTAKE